MMSHPKSPRATRNEAEHRYFPRPQVLNKDMNERVTVVPYAYYDYLRLLNFTSRICQQHSSHLFFLQVGILTALGIH